MVARVVPSIRLPRRLEGIFDYAVPQELAARIQRGSIVLVPWRGRPLPGVVVGVAAKASDGVGALKEIQAVLGARSIGGDVVAAIEATAVETVSSLATVVHAFFPTMTARTVKGAMEMPPIDAAPMRPSGFAARRVVFRSATAEEKFAAVADAAKVALARNESSLVLVPHSADVAECIVALEACGISGAIALHGGLTPAAYRKAWLGILNATKPVVVVGTRIAALAPVTSLGLLAVLEAESHDHRQYDQNPRFDARRIALERADAAVADIIFLSHAPRADEYALATNAGFSLNESSVADAPVTFVTPPLGMKKTLSDRFGEAVAEGIAEALQKKEKVLIFHNRRGLSPAFICRDCRRVLRCPTCDIALALHGGSGQRLLCHRCGASQPVPALCPNCGGNRLVGCGIGSESLAALAAEAFPDARIGRFDTDAALPSPARIAAAEILVGTHLLLHALCESEGAPRFGAIVASDADSWLSRPGYRAKEQAWRLMRMLRDLAGKNNAPLFVTAADAENPKLRSLLTPWREECAAELAARTSAGYPPAATQVALTVRADSADGARKQAAALGTALRNTLGDAATVFGPFRHAVPRERGKWRETCLLKSRDDARTLAALRAVPDDVIIETNPESIGA